MSSDADVPRELSGLVVPRRGSLVATGEVFEPYRLVDGDGAVVVPVAVFFAELAACGRPPTTQRSYGMDLLRWFRFLWAIGVGWDQATRVEARDFCRWLQVAVKPTRPHWRYPDDDLARSGRSGPVPGVNAVTLNGYYRAEHEFAAVEVQRLTLLANHAAVALSSARMLDDLRALTASLREQRDALSRSERIHQRLLAVTLRSGGTEGIAAVLAELLGRSVLIEDARHEVLAAAGDRDGLPPPQRRATAQFPDDASSEPLPSPAGNAADFLVSTARLNGEVAARIWLPNSPGLDAIGVRAVEHASIVVALELLRIRTGAEAEHRLRGELLVELLGSPNPPAKALIARAGLLGHDLAGPHIAMVGSAPDPNGGQFYQRVLSAVSDALRGYRPRPVTAMYRGNIVVLWPTTAGGSAEAARLVQRTMITAAGADATLAVYHPGDAGAPRHCQSYRIAKGALEIALRTGREGTLVELTDLGVAGLLLQLDDTAQLIEFADRTLGPVLDYDHRHRTELLETLRAYLDCRLDRGATAARVHIHPNTVGQRIRRIEQLCGIELSDPSIAAQFSTALTVRDVALRNR